MRKYFYNMLTTLVLTEVRVVIHFGYKGDIRISFKCSYFKISKKFLENKRCENIKLIYCTSCRKQI